MTTARLPGVGRIPTLVLPPISDERLESGLRVVAARHASVPVVEMRLAIRLYPGSFTEAAVHELLAATLLQGTKTRDHHAIVDDLADVGCFVSAFRSARRLIVTGSGPASSLAVLLDVLADALESAAYSDPVVDAARCRASEQILATRGQPNLVASQALMEHLYDELPQLQDVPGMSEIAAVTAADLRAAHHDVLRGDDAVMVLVGDIDPDDAITRVRRALGAWRGRTSVRPATALVHRNSGITVVDRAGAAQSQIRLVRPCLDRNDPGYAALTLANYVFGGYFSSRLVADVRESRGLAYHCEASFTDHLDQVMLAVHADTATASTMLTLERIRQNMRELTTRPPTGAEVDAARRYVTGMTALAVSSQQAWASSLLMALVLNQEPDRITRFLGELTDTGTREVAAAAATFFDPEDYHGVVLGDSKHFTQRETTR